MDRKKKPAIRVKLTEVSEELTQELGRELEGREAEGSRSATGWNDPYRASGVKHGASG